MLPLTTVVQKAIHFDLFARLTRLIRRIHDVVLANEAFLATAASSTNPISLQSITLIRADANQTDGFHTKPNQRKFTHMIVCTKYVHFSWVDSKKSVAAPAAAHSTF